MPIVTGFPGMSRGFGGPAYIRRDLRDMMPTYKLIRDCMTGSRRIKQATSEYLPRPFPASKTNKANEQRYRDYVKRAVFYNVGKRTAKAMVGEIFGRDPQVVLPSRIEAFVDNISGDGLDAEQVAHTLAHYSLSFGRGGMLVDYPSTDGIPPTQADINAGVMQPIMLSFAPWQIVNWRTMFQGAKEVLSLVVIFEGVGVQDDGFETKLGFQYRELRLDPETGNYTVNVWRHTSGDAIQEGTAQGLGIFQSYIPTDARGAPLTEIPFHFVGAENNNPSIDEPPLYDICELNISHYRNSADYEELMFMMGQPTQYFTGLTREWVDAYLENQVFLGSRASIPLPQGATAGMLQIQQNPALMQAMEQKERQMATLGAKLVQQKLIQRTATEATIEDQAENSELGLIACNVSKVMTWGFQTCCIFTGDDPAKIEYQLNTSFDLAQLDPPERLQLLKEWQAGAIAWEEYRGQLRKSGVATMDDDKAKAAIEDEMANIYGGSNPSVWDTVPKPTPGAPVGGAPGKPGQPPAVPPAPNGAGA